MKRWKWRLALLAAAAGVLLSAGCGKQQAEREPLTILTEGWDYTDFQEALHKVHPEIRLEFVSYRGANTTETMKQMLANGDMTDLFSITVLPDEALAREQLVDLSAQSFLNRYPISQLERLTDEDGGMYLIPGPQTITGMVYNQTLFEKYGWSAPETIDELLALVPKAREKGIDLMESELYYPGGGFCYFINTGEALWLNTPEGHLWKEAFQSGQASAADSLQQTAEQFQKFIDAGLMNRENVTRNVKSCYDDFRSRKSAIWLDTAPIDFWQHEDGTGDRYGLLPYLSVDGGNNVYMTNVLRYYGISRRLEEPGNEQKLEDAWKVLDFIATPDGQAALGADGSSKISTLIEDELAEDSPIYEAKKRVDEGYGIPLPYAGWEDVVSVAGSEIQRWILGESTAGQVLERMDRAKQAAASGDNRYARAVKSLTLEETAELVAASMMEAADTDAALMSLGGYRDGEENPAGVNARLYAGDITDLNYTTVLGVRGRITVLTLTGRELKELAEQGLIIQEDGAAFPYVLKLRDEGELLEEQTYRVAVNPEGFSARTAEAGSARETEIDFFAAYVDYIRAAGSITPET